MTDRELLELAAKAAGYQIEWVRNSGCHYRCEEDVGREQWCPLEDDGDALRLAHAIGMQLNLDECNDMTDVRTDIVMAAAAFGLSLTT